MRTITILGSGRVGATIAKDLATQFNVIAIDRNDGVLANLINKKNITPVCADISNPKTLAGVIASADLVVNAVPGFMGYAILKSVIENRKNVVDISFFPENALSLHPLALKNEVTAIVDMGVAPGMNNFLLGYHDQHMHVHTFACYVGGLPKHPKPPFYYKAPFSPIDVLEEYTRPARLMQDGKKLTMPALSAVETIVIENIGSLEAFNTDGLRTLLTNLEHIPNMIEKTLRYPGHIAVIESLKSLGFLDTTPLNEQFNSLSALALTGQILTEQWRLDPDEPEFTVMRVIITGEQNGMPVTHQYDLYDEYDPINDDTSMARTTGFACTAAVNLLLENKFKEYGVIAPETLGANEGSFEYFMNYLEQRNINYKVTTTN